MSLKSEKYPIWKWKEQFEKMEMYSFTLPRSSFEEC